MQKLRNWISKDDSVFKEFGHLTEGLTKHLLALNQRSIHEDDRKIYVGLVVYELLMLFEKFMLQDVLEEGRPLLPSE